MEDNEQKVETLREKVLIEKESLQHLLDKLSEIEAIEKETYEAMTIDKLGQESELGLNWNNSQNRNSVQRGAETMMNFKKQKLPELFSRTMNTYFGGLKNENEEEYTEERLETVFEMLEAGKEGIRETVEEVLKGLNQGVLSEIKYNMSTRITMSSRPQTIDIDSEKQEIESFHGQIGYVIQDILKWRSKIVALFYQDIIREYKKHTGKIKSSASFRKTGNKQSNQSTRLEKQRIQQNIKTRLEDELESVIQGIKQKSESKSGQIGDEINSLKLEIEQHLIQKNHRSAHRKKKATLLRKERDFAFQAKIAAEKSEYERLKLELERVTLGNNELQTDHNQKIQGFFQKREDLHWKYMEEEREYMNESTGMDSGPSLRQRDLRAMDKQIENNSGVIKKLRKSIQEMGKLQNALKFKGREGEKITTLKKLLEEETANQLKHLKFKEHGRFKRLIEDKNKSKF